MKEKLFNFLNKNKIIILVTIYIGIIYSIYFPDRYFNYYFGILIPLLILVTWYFKIRNIYLKIFGAIFLILSLLYLPASKDFVIPDNYASYGYFFLFVGITRDFLKFRNENTKN